MSPWETAVARPLRALRLDSIRNKILAFAVLATLIPSLITGTISYLENRRSLTEKITDQLRIASSQTAREVDLWVKERLHALRTLASSYEVSENLETAGAGPGSPSSRRLRDYLRSVRERLADYEDLTVVDRNGRLVATTRPNREITLPPGWLEEIRANHAVMGDPYWDADLGRLVVVMAVPIGLAENRLLGALTASLRLRSAAEVLGQFSPGQSGEVYLVTGPDGFVLSTRDTSGSRVASRLDSATVRRLLARPDTATEYTAVSGEAVVGTLSPVPAMSAGVIAEVPRRDAYRQVTRLLGVTVLMVTGLLLGVGLLGYALAQVIIRPLDRLTAGAAKVAAGDLDVDLPVVGGGEVRYLTVVFNDMVKRLREGRQELERLSVTDGLTGLFNRRRLIDALTAEVKRAERAQQIFTVMMVDVDHFKQFNDTYGHPAGDAVLVRVAAILREATREVDLAARYGGEEFLLVLAATDTAGATEVAERIRARLAGEVFDGGAITVSMGLAEFPADGATPSALIMSADAALYQAKHEGRDRIVKAPPGVTGGSPG